MPKTIAKKDTALDPFLASFNAEQRDAVTHGTGPLLIIAGAGTGKTRVITGRIAHLIQSGRAKPSEILALTFTEKATQEMQERVDRILPLGYEELWIKTFHSFCDAILRERGLDIGLDTHYRLLSSVEQWLFVKKHLYKFELDYYRPLSKPTQCISALLQHFSRLKDEYISPDAYVAHAEKLVEKGGDASLQETAAKTLEVARAYQTYQKFMLEENALDFGDLLFYTLQLLEKRPSVLAALQERFRYILVDEYQDTNYAQNKIIELLAKKHGNIMVCGDDDQALYRFRGASVENILTFKKLFPQAKNIVLTENYRSPQQILDSAYRLIQHNNPYRLEVKEQVKKKLQARVAAPETFPMTVRHFSHYLEEVKFVCDVISEKPLSERGGCAILVRASAHADAFLEELKRRDISYQFIGSQGLLRREEVKDIVAILRVLSNFNDDIALFRVLSMPVFNLPMNTVVDFVNSSRATNERLFTALQKHAGAPPSLFEDPHHADFSSVRTLLQKLLDYSKGHSASEVIGTFLKDTKLIEGWMKETSAQNQERIQTIAEFSKLVARFENESKEKRVFDFVEYLDMLEEAGEQTRVTMTDLDPTAVKIMTVHAAKGLEFPTVFLVSLVAHRFPSMDRKDTIPIPEELIPEKLPSDDMHVAEERRLFYVGCTRAEQHLFLSWSDMYEGKKKWKQSPFLNELLGTEILEKIQHTLAPSLVPRSPLRAIAPRTTHGKPKKTLSVVSYSQLDAFAICPLKYKFRYLYSLEPPPSHTANFGNSVHGTLKDFYQRLKDGKQPSKTLLQTLYKENWIPYGYDTKTHEQKRFEKGWSMLERFYDIHAKPKFLIPEFIERNFRLKIGDIWVNGRIDRIDRLQNGNYEVIDYKTGALKKNFSIKKDFQLSLYALACRDVFRIPVEKLSLYFLEDNQKISTTRTDADLAHIEEDLLKRIQSIIDSDFSPTPGYPCTFCEYRILCHAASF